ncbi:MAG TPA: aspartate--tRNA(Asn) ligase, partial [candidate division WWE3 bacterium]|nr:aspartate--tRNA(Asn) ligase [candidate division WWE3 bacterium]
DFEISYIDSHADVMDALEEALVSGFEKLRATVLPELAVPTRPFSRMTMAEVKEKLAQAGVPSEKEHDISPEEEREICRIIKEETGHDFVFVTEWHKNARPFYHMRHEDNPDITKSFDLLYKGVEITTGAQREHRLDVLKAQAQEKGLSLDSIAEYLEFFAYGCPPHGGAGIGPGRIVMKILDLLTVKEATYLPRDVKRLKP